MRSQANDALLVAVIVGASAFLATGVALAHGESIADVAVGNKTYQVSYNMSYGNSISSITGESNYPYGGGLSIELSPAKVGSLNMSIPRDLYNDLGFADHEVDVAVYSEFAETFAPFDFEFLDSTSCDQVSISVAMTLPSDEIMIGTTDILSVHDHQIPAILELTETIAAEGKEFELVLRTDAVECDISFMREEKKMRIDIDAADKSKDGYFSISIPRQLLGGDYTVLVDGEPAVNAQIFTTALGSLDGTDPNTSTVSLYFGPTAKSIDIIGTSVVSEWETAYAVGKFLNSEPPKPDQIFRIEYRAINGTIESFDMQQTLQDVLISNTIIAKIKDGSSDGVLEVKFPRNFPYSNSGSGAGKLFVFIGGTEIAGEDNRITTECFFVLSLPFKGDTDNIQIAMESILIKSPYHGDDIPDSCASQTTKDVPVRQDGTISPLHQFRAGIEAEDILCKEGLDLVTSPKGKPYCAKPDTARMLAELWN